MLKQKFARLVGRWCRQGLADRRASRHWGAAAVTYSLPLETRRNLSASPEFGSWEFVGPVVANHDLVDPALVATGIVTTAGCDPPNTTEPGLNESACQCGMEPGDEMVPGSDCAAGPGPAPVMEPDLNSSVDGPDGNGFVDSGMQPGILARSWDALAINAGTGFSFAATSALQGLSGAATGTSAIPPLNGLVRLAGSVAERLLPSVELAETDHFSEVAPAAATIKREADNRLQPVSLASPMNPFERMAESTSSVPSRSSPARSYYSEPDADNFSENPSAAGSAIDRGRHLEPFQAFAIIDQPTSPETSTSAAHVLTGARIWPPSYGDTRFDFRPVAGKDAEDHRHDGSVAPDSCVLFFPIHESKDQLSAVGRDAGLEAGFDTAFSAGLISTLPAGSPIRVADDFLLRDAAFSVFGIMLVREDSAACRRPESPKVPVPGRARCQPRSGSNGLDRKPGEKPAF